MRLQTINETLIFESAVNRRADSIAVEVRNLKKSYGDLAALAGVDVLLKKGEVLGILGPNGAGKTTLLEILKGTLAFDSGQVSVLGVDMGVDPQKNRGKITTTMQNSSLPLTAKVKELIVLYLEIYNCEISVSDVLREVGLTEKGNSRISHLSGGQKQRLAIALALLGDGNLMFFDEPTSELDPQGRRQVWESIQNRVNRGRCTVVITTHQMEEAATLCDKLIIIDKGTIVASGTNQDLIQKHCPGLKLIVRFNAEVDVTYFIEKFLHSKSVVMKGRTKLDIPCEDFDEAMFRATSVKKLFIRNEIESLAVESKTLEDVFLKITGRILRD